MKKAFSLMELAISLIVIGVIIGAVISARDLINSAHSKEFYQSFIGKWISVINTYYDKSGSNLTDSSQNGGSETLIDGYFDGINIFDTNNETNLINALKNVGINPCELINSNVNDLTPNLCKDNINPFKYNIAGEFTDSYNVTVGFRKYIINEIPKNFIIFINMAGDLASNIDRIIDGKSNGTNGKCLAIQSNDIIITSNDDIPTNNSEFDNANLLNYTNIGEGKVFIIAIEIDS